MRSELREHSRISPRLIAEHFHPDVWFDNPYRHDEAKKAQPRYYSREIRPLKCPYHTRSSVFPSSTEFSGDESVAWEPATSRCSSLSSRRSLASSSPSSRDTELVRVPRESIPEIKLVCMESLADLLTNRGMSLVLITD